MLPLITLSQAEIDVIIAKVAGGIANIQDIYGLIPVQNGMLFHHVMSENGDPYLVTAHLEFTNRATLERYASALEHVGERHDILRTIFIWEGLSEPAQVVLRHVPSILEDITLDDTNEPLIDQLNRLYDPHHYRIDLTQPPLLRLVASPSSDGSYVALQLMHQSIIDHLTWEKVQIEINTIIEGEMEDLGTPTPFRDLVAHVRLGTGADEHKRYFTKMLGKIDEPTLPFGLSDVGHDGTNMSEFRLKLPQTRDYQLRGHSKSLETSISTICHVAWANVLARATGCEAIVFGTVVNVGCCLQTEDKKNNQCLGPLINTLPIRVNLDETTGADLVLQTATQLKELTTHEHAPLVLAQRCSRVPPGLPLFSSLFIYKHNKKTALNRGEVSGISFKGIVEERTNYPITLTVEDDDECLAVRAQIISSVSAERICLYMQQAMVSLANAITHRWSLKDPVRTLTVVPKEECKMLLNTWNETAVNSPPVESCLHQLFENQVDRDEHATAVECNGVALSYEELNQLANRLAHHLVSKGVKPDDLIALCVDRSLALIIAILGILKAGAAYVPLDPNYASQRLNHTLKDANPVLLLADSIGRKALGDHEVPTIDLDEKLSDNLPNDNLEEISQVTPNNLAYVMYTSGSTGTPKGVMVEHRHVVRLFDITKDKFDFNTHDLWCLFHSISFDVSVFEIWGALLNGSQLKIVPNSVTRSLDEFYDWVCDNAITVLNQTPSAFRSFLRTKNILSRFERLRYIIFAGEEMDPAIVRDWNEKCDKNQTTLVNMYGTTETTIHATYQRLDDSESVCSIGRPLADLRTYLLDPYGQPVPLGAEGELYIGGGGVARGYLNRPELTEERFLPDKSCETEGARMYRTGDRAKYLSDGRLVYLGRRDEQIKVHGFRVELSDIEHHLVKHPQVREAVVRPYGNGSDACLVAYVVGNTDASLPENLRTYLSNLLPDYMVPSAFVCLRALPLTPNGKLDCRSLPAPGDDASMRHQYEAPRGEIEEILANLWREILKVDRVGRNENFFELGGQSMLVMQMINKAKLSNIHITNHGVFSFPILKDLAAQIDNRTNRLYCEVAIPIRHSGNETPLFLVPDGWGGVSYAFDLARDIDKNIPVYVLPWASPENEQPHSIEEMADKMITLMKKVHPNGPYATAGYASGGFLAYEIAKQLIKSGSGVSFLGLIGAFPPTENTISETGVFLADLLHLHQCKMTIFNDHLLNDKNWWDSVSKLSIDQAVEEVKKILPNSNSIDIEWQKLLSKQRYNYRKLCTAFSVDSLPIKVHIFRAVEKFSTPSHFAPVENVYKTETDSFVKLSTLPKLGWDNFNSTNDFHIVSVNGDNHTMMTVSKNRASIGRRISTKLK